MKQYYICNLGGSWRFGAFPNDAFIKSEKDDKAVYSGKPWNYDGKWKVWYKMCWGWGWSSNCWRLWMTDTSLKVLVVAVWADSKDSNKTIGPSSIETSSDFEEAKTQMEKIRKVLSNDSFNKTRKQMF